MKIEKIGNITPFEAFAALRHFGKPFIFTGRAREFSFVGAGPVASIECFGEKTVIERCGERFAQEKGDAFNTLSKMLSEYKQGNKGPFDFNSGLAGYFAYDLKGTIAGLRQTQIQKLKKHEIPVCSVGLYDPVYVHDGKEGFLVSYLEQGNFNEMKEALLSAKPFAPAPVKKPEFISRTKKEDFLDAVLKAKEYISEGDIYQINLSHRLEAPFDEDPFFLFTDIISKSPSLFSSYMEFNGLSIISNSPERFLKIKGDTAETSPIKGTRPRGKSASEDRALKEALLASAKERAEHVMIVDLERNDIGKVSVTGSVQVTGFNEIETHPGLHHMASTIKGTLKPGIGVFECLREVFPGGSITGAPKIRAMEIIDELEPVERGLYTGGLGWIDLSGDADISMAIRTAVCRDKKIFLHVGSGIVADSVPQEEYDETMLKAKDFIESGKEKG